MKMSSLVALLVIVLLAACGEDDPVPTDGPTLPPTEIVQQATSTTTVTPGGPTQTPSPTFRPSATLAPPSETSAPPPPDTPTPTRTPRSHEVRTGQTCLELALFYDVSVDAIEQANELSDCRTIFEGQVLVIPYPSSTPTPFGYEQTATAIFVALPTQLRHVTPFEIYQYCAVEGDTVISIALLNDSTVKRICDLNPLPGGIDCRGCDFSESANGGCDPRPLIVEGQCYNVPGPTYTPTVTPTLSGDTPPTLTPTHSPPQAILPMNNEVVVGSVRLVWVGLDELRPNEFYVVNVMDEATGQQILYEGTRESDISLPNEWRPAAGESRQVVWSVEIAVLSENEIYIPVSGRSISQRFTWEG